MNAIRVLAALTTIAMWLAHGAEEGFTPLFNGRDLAGWDGKPGWWRE